MSDNTPLDQAQEQPVEVLQHGDDQSQNENKNEEFEQEEYPNEQQEEINDENIQEIQSSSSQLEEEDQYQQENGEDNDDQNQDDEQEDREEQEENWEEQQQEGEEENGNIQEKQVEQSKQADQQQDLHLDTKEKQIHQKQNLDSIEGKPISQENYYQERKYVEQGKKQNKQMDETDFIDFEVIQNEEHQEQYQNQQETQIQEEQAAFNQGGGTHIQEQIYAEVKVQAQEDKQQQQQWRANGGITMHQHSHIHQQQQQQQQKHQPAFNEEEETQEPAKMLSPDELNAIFNEFKTAIRNYQTDKVITILKKYQKFHNLANKIDIQSRQISTFVAANLPTDDQTYNMLKILIDNGANSLFRDQLKQSVLFYVAKDGKMKSLELLFQHGADPNEVDSNGQTPLFFAARDNRIEAVSELIRRGANAFHLDKIVNQSALFYAARYGNNEVCNILIQNGCKVNHQDSTKKFAINFAKQFKMKETVDLLQEHMNKLKNEENKLKDPSKKQKQTKEAAPAGANAQNPPSSSQNEPNSHSAEGSAFFDTKLSQQDSKKIDSKGRNRKPMKDQAKMSYKLVYTDENGQQKELSKAEYQGFKQQYPDITKILENADEMINEDVYGREKDSWEKVAKKILQAISKMRGSYLFQQPVDVVKYKIDDYYTIVKKPMDFGTIKTKLNTNVYGSCKEFLEDTSLVFYNCILYNGSDSEVGRICLQVKQEFKKYCLSFDIYQFLSPEQMEHYGTDQNGQAQINQAQQLHQQQVQLQQAAQQQQQQTQHQHQQQIQQQLYSQQATGFEEEQSHVTINQAQSLQQKGNNIIEYNNDNLVQQQQLQQQNQLYREDQEGHSGMEHY